MMEAVSGSKSDKNTIMATMKKLRENISLDEEALYIADSSFFTKKNIEQMGEDNKFLTRAPATVNVVKELERAEHDFEKTANPNYQYKEVEGEYAGMRIKYIVVHSKEMQAMKEKSIDRRLKKEKEEAGKSLKKICNQTWYCEADALSALEKWGREKGDFVMKIAAAYGKYSSDRQSDTSIETQIEKIEQYCAMHEYELRFKYVDRALTAATDKRPEFLQAIQDAKTGKFDALIVYKFDRFARNLENAIVYSKMLEKYNVLLLSVNESLPEGASGKLMYNIISSINDFYLENLRHEVKEKGSLPFSVG